VNFPELLHLLSSNTATSLRLFRPELILCGTIVAMLLVRVLRFERCIPAALVALIGAVAGLWFAVHGNHVFSGAIERQEIFTGMLVYDAFTIYFRSLLLFFAVLYVLFTQLSGIPDREDAADFYSLVLGATLGMCIMASANHVLTIFLGVEMASVPSYVLAGMLKGRRKSSEAALKYVVYGAGTAGIMLYGLSLLAGVLGSCHLPTMAAQLAEGLRQGALADKYVVLALGGLMVGVGLCFKLSAVPFQFWCPDVFEGASAEVNAFLSVASKAAALALLVRVCAGLGYIPEKGSATFNPQAAKVATDEFYVAAPAAETATVAADTAPLPAVQAGSPSDRAAPAGSKNSASNQAAAEMHRVDDANTSLLPIRKFMALVIAFIAAITCTFGNLAAYGQTNMKRLLAYSTIAHAGYMLMPIVPALLLAGPFPRDADQAIGAVTLYVGIYLFMNLTAFAIVAFLRNTLHSEQIADYGGLIRRSPGLVLCFSVVLFSLVGLPPLAGFTGKFVIFTSLVTAFQKGLSGPLMLTLLVVAGLNTCFSLFYYLRVVKVMALDPEPDRVAPSTFTLLSLPGGLVALLTLPVVGLGVWWNDLVELARTAAAHLFS
jgi:NADH-quinone oxidoreductase subunit N